MCRDVDLPAKDADANGEPAGAKYRARLLVPVLAGLTGSRLALARHFSNQ